jgi:hypothetical protein
MRSLVRQLYFIRVLTVVPKRRARLVRVSPLCTVYWTHPAGLVHLRGTLVADALGLARTVLAVGTGELDGGLPVAINGEGETSTGGT